MANSISFSTLGVTNTKLTNNLQEKIEGEADQRVTFIGTTGLDEEIKI